ncbi:MAG: hypothetical protein ACLQVY_24145, partial [Limisphaerales bacterium]
TSANTAGTIVARDGSGNFVAGTITANLAGNAATATTAANVTGTIAASQLPTNVPLLNGTNAFTGANSFAGVTMATNVNNVIKGTFNGNAGGLTNLQSTNLNSINVQPCLVSPMLGLSVYTQTSSAVSGANTVYVVPLLISWPTWITNACFTIGTAGSGGFLGISIYNSSGSKVLDTGPQSTATIGTFHPVMTNTSNTIGQTLQPGTYYVGWTCNNTTAAFTSITGTAALQAVMNANSSMILEGTAGTVVIAGQTPSSLGTLAAANVTHILFCVFQ